MRDWLDNVLGAHGWVGEVFVVVLVTAIVHLALRVSLARFARHVDRTRNVYDNALVDAARGPLGWAVWLIGVSAAAELAGGSARAEIFDYVDEVRETGVIGLLVWFTVRFISLVEASVVDARVRTLQADRTTAAAVGKLLRASVVITGVLMILQSLGFSISGVLAFGGIGGIAIGFAARDLLANFFGALMIFFDRPFSVGDWIRSPEKEIEGTVEDIGWRLTRIRTFDARPLYVPNATFASITVENPSRMTNRRIYETVGVRYRDIAALPDIVAEVEAMLKDHDSIDQTRTLMVHFVKFGASSLDFFVYAFTKTTDWTEFHAVKQDVLFRISDIVSAHGAEVAFPTQTILLEQPT